MTVTGTVKRPDDSYTLQEFARTFSQEHSCTHFFYDLARAEIIADTLGNFQSGSGPDGIIPARGVIKIAALYAGDLQEHEFLETVANNRGYPLKIFNDREEATRWLTAP